MKRSVRVVETARAGEFVAIALDTCEVTKLLYAGTLSGELADAASRLYGDWYASGLPGFGASWSEGGVPGWRGSPLERMSPSQEGRWREYDMAIRAVPRPVREEVIETVLWNNPPTSTRRLVVGLKVLRRHYAK